VHAAKYRAYLDHYRALFGSDGAGAAEAADLEVGISGSSPFGPAPPDEPVAALDGTDRVGGWRGWRAHSRQCFARDRDADTM
jgi:hypothetical protein